MGSEPSVWSCLVNLGLALYSVHVVFAAIDGEDAVRWAEEQHRQGHDRYARGHGNGRSLRARGGDQGGRHGRGGAG